MSKDSMSKDSMSKDSMSKVSMSKDSMSKVSMSKDSMSKVSGVAAPTQKRTRAHRQTERHAHT
jgi:hypothetical protein